MMNDLNDLLQTLEQLRQTKQPSVPPALIEEIVRIQAEWTDNIGEAKRRMSAAIQRYLDKGGAAE